MASTAISAQGSKLEIATGTGAAKNITGITQSNPCVVTMTAHGFSKGDVVTIASVSGMTQINGSSYVVQYTTPNTVALAGVDSTAFAAYTSGGTATPQAWTQVNNLDTFSGFDGQAAEIDVTNLSSTANEFIMGIPRSGQFTVTLDQDLSDPGQAACLLARDTVAKKSFRLTLPNASTATFSGYVKRFGTSGGVDQKVKVPSMDIGITGAVTRA